jgi:hypothetical protein
VWITGQVRRVTRPIRREMKRRAAVEPVIGHVKAEHRLGRNYLEGRDRDAAMPCWPPPATTLPSSCAGWRGSFAPSSGRSVPRPCRA